MVALMAAKKTKKDYKRPADKTDVFARLDVGLAERFDRLVSGAMPPTTRSKYIAMLIRQHVEQREKERGKP